ncbi:MAG: hypothetical protein AB1546_04000 [bacterium]
MKKFYYKKYAFILITLILTGLIIHAITGKLLIIARGVPTACILFTAIALFIDQVAGKSAAKNSLLLLIVLWLISPFYFPYLPEEEFKPMRNFSVYCEDKEAHHEIVIRKKKHLELVQAVKEGKLHAKVYVQKVKWGPQENQIKVNGITLAPEKYAASELPSNAFRIDNGIARLSFRIKNPRGQFIYRPIPPGSDVRSYCINNGKITLMQNVRLMVELRFYDGKNRILYSLY